MTQSHPNDGPTARSSWQEIALFLITLAVLVLSGMMLRPFLPAITGAIVLAVVTRRPYCWLEARLRRPSLAAFISVVLVVLCIIVPVSYLGQNLVHHLFAAARRLQQSSAPQNVQSYVEQSPRLSRAARYLSENFDINGALSKSAAVIGRWVALLLGGSIQAIYQTIILLFPLFFLYRDHARAARALRGVLPLSDPESTYLLTRLASTIRATVLGRFVVAGVQGLVAGLTYALLGVPAASLFGIATALLALVPSFGAFLVWVPIDIWLAIGHHWMQAIILAVVGSVVISLLDNFLYPILVGNQVQLHTALIFFSLLGGAWMFGLSGLVLGPILFTAVGSLLHIWKARLEDRSLDASREGIGLAEAAAGQAP
jgi:predicted PurR-regulated permease PerM